MVYSECDLTRVPRVCPYRLRFGADDDDVYRVSQMARNRVCVRALAHTHSLCR